MSDTPADFQQCPAVRKDGTQCRGKVTASGWCFAHDPASNEWRSKGGQHTRKSERALRRLPERLRPVADLLARALEEVHEGEVEPRVGTAMAALASALVKVLQAGELEQRVLDLETLARGEGRYGA